MPISYQMACSRIPLPTPSFAHQGSYDQGSTLIITTNKAPKEWAEVLHDQVLTIALLDRILHRSEIIKLQGNSYRMKNRKTIF